MNENQPDERRPEAAGTSGTLPPAAGEPTEPLAAQAPTSLLEGDAPPAQEDPPVWSAATAAGREPVTARRTRVSTLVLGLILTMIGLGAVLTGLGYRLDLQLSLAVLLVVAAVALLVTAVTRRDRTGA